ncbi:hypothetical protein H6P81_011870 [Aristolochia fimbriata]|uniref:TmcB/TmcC TPR repeats domain-containing protein n=1 Tax=Aristolochia fimbriata TaxID=158543 RepID=A0AAV7EDF8_ARIFI|nr:hypothetical protein H6P81_011870 [Aristolochia fimbriata]
MLLRSSSTPILGSLLSSESPNNFDHNRPPPSSDNHKKLSFHATSHNCHPFSWNSFPMSHAGGGFSEFKPESNSSPKGFRRAQSDGNLQALAALEVDDGFRNSTPMKSSKKHHGVLQTIPSFSVYRPRYEEEEDVQGGEDEQVDCEDGLERSVTIGENISSNGTDFCFPSDNEIGFVQQVRDERSEEILSIGRMGSPSLFLAKSLGIDDSGLVFNGNGGDGSNFPPLGANGPGDASVVEDYYKRMVEENPSSALVLRNYAHFLHKTKKDFRGAEEYYSRAILAEPGDGEVLSQYAQLIWQFYHDSKKASRYFEQAVQSAPDNSHVLAAYANFLWEAEDEEEEGEDSQSQKIPFVRPRCGTLQPPYPEMRSVCNLDILTLNMLRVKKILRYNSFCSGRLTQEVSKIHKKAINSGLHMLVLYRIVGAVLSENYNTAINSVFLDEKDKMMSPGIKKKLRSEVVISEKLKRARQWSVTPRIMMQAGTEMADAFTNTALDPHQTTGLVRVYKSGIRVIYMLARAILSPACILPHLLALFLRRELSGEAKTLRCSSETPPPKWVARISSLIDFHGGASYLQRGEMCANTLNFDEMTVITSAGGQTPAPSSHTPRLPFSADHKHPFKVQTLRTKTHNSFFSFLGLSSFRSRVQ